MSVINNQTTKESNLIIGKANSTYSLFEITIENDITVFTKVKANFARSLEKAQEKYPNLEIDASLNGANVLKRKYNEDGTYTDLSEKKKTSSKTRTPKVKATDKDLPKFNKQISKFNTGTYKFTVVNQPKLMVMIEHIRYKDGETKEPINNGKFALNGLSPRRIVIENYDIDWNSPIYEGKAHTNSSLYKVLKETISGIDTYMIGYPLKVKDTKR